MRTGTQNVSTPGGQETDALIRFEDVRKVYQMGTQQVHALAGVSLSVLHGGFWAITGSSGSGKSTLLNLIGCLDRPTSGRYLFEGRDVNSLDDDDLSELRLRRLGFIFQSFNLIPQLTVQENIELPLYYQGREAHLNARRSRELADLVGLGNRLTHRPAELSGGQQQRVAIARSLANDPPILLADEPTGNLDSATGKQIMEFLAHLNAEGKTIILVTHERDIAAYTRQRIHMRDGLIHSVEGG